MEGAPTQDDINLGPAMLEVCWTLAAVASIVVALRLLTRLNVNHGLRMDDFFMVLALVS